MPAVAAAGRTGEKVMKGEEGAVAGSASLLALALGDKRWPGAEAFWGRREGEAGRVDFAAGEGAAAGVWGRGGILWLFADSGLNGSLLLEVVVVVVVVVVAVLLLVI